MKELFQKLMRFRERERERERESKPLRGFVKFLLAFFVFSFCFLQIRSPVLASSTLNTGVTSFWKLDEATGATRNDSVGTNNLTDNGSVAQIAGKVGNGAHFTFSSAQHLSISDNASLSTGDIDFTFSTWVYLDSKGANRYIFEKSGGQFEYGLRYRSSLDRFTFIVSNDGASLPLVNADALGSPSTGTWYFIVVWHDSTANTINIQINDGAVNSTAHTTGVFDGTGTFNIGLSPINGAYMDGRIDAVGFWKRVLTSSERTELYNSGNGVEYLFGSGVTVPTVTTQAATSVTATGATGNGNITDIGGATPTTRGFNYGLTTGYGSTTTEIGSFPTGAFTGAISGLTCNTLYHIRAYAANSGGTGYGGDQSFTTSACPNGITITAPVAYRVFQRNSSNQANISITGTYTGSPTAIEASWNGGVYTTITASPTGGTFSGTLSNQTAGQGTLTVRFTNDTSTTASKSYIGVGDIFVIAGQSNAMGYGFNNQTYSSSLKASLFGNDDNWKELIDPTDSNTNQVDSVSSDASAMGSVWPLVATHFLADQGVPIAFVPAANNGSSIENWQPNSSNHGNTTTLYGSMYRRINAIGGVKAILFWQGERNAALSTSRATYKSELESFVDSANADFGVKTIVAEIGDRSFAVWGSSDLDSIRLAQQDAWDEDTNVLPGPVLYDVVLTDEGGDGLHFRSDGDLATAGNRWWAAMQADFYGGTDGRGPRISAAEYNSTKTQITLTFTDTTLPLLPASGYGGFTVKDNGVSATISTITKTATNKLLITLSSAASGTITISLGQGETGTGATVPTDSSTYNLPAEVFVDHATTQLDETAPTISNVSSGTPTSSGTTITWTTNENASSKVDYGLTTSYGTSTTETDTPTGVTSHSVALSSLSSCTTYHYRVRSIDTALNETIDSDNTFITTGCTTSSSSSSNNSSSTSTAVCSDTAPTGTTPWLYETNANSGNSITLRFTNWQTPVDHFVLEYGTQSNKYIFGVTSFGNKDTNLYTINSLNPNTTYYFRVRAGNGCATGSWSNELSTKTLGFISTNNLSTTQSTITPVEQPSSCQTYTVKSGDTLWSIATNLLGNGNKYQNIVNENLDSYPNLKTSSNINIGWELKINCQGETNKSPGATTNTPTGGYKVNIKVKDTKGSPVENATVTLHSTPQTEKTNKDGTATFNNVEAGNHTVLIAYNNYQGEQSINLTGDVKEFNINVTVQQKPILLSPLAYGIIGIMGLVIAFLTFKLIKKNKIKKL